jgi:hypothetical protein
LTARQIRQQERAARREAQRAAANVHRIGIGANVKNNLPGTLLRDTSPWCVVFVAACVFAAMGGDRIALLQQGILCF